MDMKLLLQLMERAPRQTVQPGNVMDDPVRIYFAIKALFLKFKRLHQVECMQKVTLLAPSSHKRPNCSHVYSPVIPRMLICDRQYSLNDLIQLMRVKECVGGQAQRELQEEMTKAIDKLEDVKGVIKCYVRLLNREYEIGNMDCYSAIEQMMIKKIVKMKMLPDDFDSIARHLCRLPQLGLHIMEFIGFLYDQAPSFQHFHMLFNLFKGISHSHPSPNGFMARLRICNPQNSHYLTTLIASNNGDRSIMFAAWQVAREKIRMLPHQLNQKDKYNLGFIIQTLHYGLPLWDDLFLWEKQASAQAIQYLQQRLSPFLIDSVRKQVCHIILAVVAAQKRQGWMTVLLARELLREGKREMLAFKGIRRFLAEQALAYQTINLSLQECCSLLLAEDLRLSGILLELFCLPSGNVMKFCFEIFQDNGISKKLLSFIEKLSQQKPVEFKKAYITWYLMEKPKDIQASRTIANTILYKLQEKMAIGVALMLIRDLADLPPISYLYCTLQRILKKFPSSQSQFLLKKHAARCLNMLLVRSHNRALPGDFKRKLPDFVKSNLPELKGKILQNMPEEVMEELKLAQRKRWGSYHDL